MKDKEFKRLSRSELIEIIYQLQLDQQELREENERLKASLESKELKISNAGSIAEAAIGITDIINKAQEAADLYLAEIHRNNAESESKHKAIVADAEVQAAALRRKAEADMAASQKEAVGVRLRAQTEAKQIISDAEQVAAERIKLADIKIKQMLSAHAELTNFLKR